MKAFGLHWRPPVFPDDEKTRAASVLNVLQLTIFGILALLCVGVVFIFTKKLESLAIVSGLFLAVAGSRVLMYQGRVQFASLIVVTGLWVMMTVLIAAGGGMQSTDVVQYVVITVIGGLLLGTRATVIIGVASTLVGLGFVIGDAIGYTFPQIFPSLPLSNWIKFSSGLFMTIMTLNIALRGLHDALLLSRQRLHDRDIAEAALRRSESQLRAVLDAATDISFIITDGDEVEPRVLEFSPGAERIFGYRREEMLDQPVAVLHIPEDVARFPEVTRNMRARKGGFSGETCLVRRSGEIFPALFTTYPLFDIEGQMFAALGISIDITERKQAEHEREQFEQRIRQQERLAAVGQLAAGIAHDFNNIMATVVLYTQMSMRTEGVPPIVHERLGVIFQQSMHATQLIQQILDFSHRAILERRPLDLLPLLKEQVKLLQRTLPENITVTLDYSEDAYVIYGSPTALQQVIMNLAVNARDAMPKGGELRFELARLHVTEAESDPLDGVSAGTWIKFAVTDTGTGIPADVLPHIFEPFFTTKEPGAGTGLGLAQVYGIVGMHEGQIRVETKVDAGTTFTIHLPAMATIPAAQPDFGIVELATGQGQTILVVEDSPATRQALADSLMALDYRVQVAANGQQALTILEEHPGEIALVLSDVVMPEMGGLDLIEAIQQRSIDTRVVLLTGHPLKEDWMHLNVDWILKPPSLEALAHVIAQALAKS